MPPSSNPRGDREPPFPSPPEQPDCFDEVIAQVLGKDHSSAYSMITAMERIIQQYKLVDMEAHGLLFEAYLRGKQALKQGKTIHHPQAWLKGTARNLAREKSRKARKTVAYPPELMDVLFPADEGNGMIDNAILEEEIQAVFEATQKLQQEHPEIFHLIHLRVVEGLSWQHIKQIYGQDKPGEDITEAALRKRFSRGRKYLRSIFHEVTLAK